MGTAFPESEARLRRRLAAATVDVASFRRPLSPCHLRSCRGMCCYDGVFLADDEADRIGDLAGSRAGFFRRAGLALPVDPVVADGKDGRRRRTALRPAGRQWEEASGFPAHFAHTACVFLREDGACGLQLLAADEGRHPWHYKPFPCWLHPITLRVRDRGHGREDWEITLPGPGSDPQRHRGYPGFASCTACGLTRPGGEPAWQTLAAELRLLGEIAGRDFAGEARGAG